MKNKGFTLVELLAVLVILAIIALIAIPIVMNIVENSIRESNERSVELYGTAVRNAVARLQLNGANGPLSFSGSSDELTNLDVEYKGDPVHCNTVSIYEDGKIYLAGCSVDGEPVEGFTYGKKSTVCTIQRQNSGKYTIGDVVTCTMSKSIEQFYVLENADSSAQTIEMLAAKDINVTGDIIQSDTAGQTAFATNTTCKGDIYYECGNIIKPIVDKYVMYLNENLTSAKGKLLTREQVLGPLGCNEYSFEPCVDWADGWYWISSGTLDNLAYKSEDLVSMGGPSAVDPHFGVRPVIVIQTSDIK